MIWRESIFAGDLVQNFKPVAGTAADGSYVRFPIGTLLTVVNVDGWVATVLGNSKTVAIQFLSEAVINLSHVNPHALAGKHLCAMSQLSREHPYFAAKIKAFGGGWSNKYSKKCTHVVTLLGNRNAIQYTHARNEAIKDNKKFISEEDLAKMMGLPE